MRITEASEYLGVSINTLKHMADSGQIRSYKTNGGTGQMSNYPYRPYPPKPGPNRPYYDDLGGAYLFATWKQSGNRRSSPGCVSIAFKIIEAVVLMAVGIAILIIILILGA